MSPIVDKIKKCLLIIIGTISLVLGITGLFLPVLPTTPFLLLASFCYLRSSQRLYQWLMTRKIIGAYILNYITYKAVPKSTKVFSIIFLWITLIASMILIGHWHVRIFLILVGLGVSIHLLMLKTIKKSEMLLPELKNMKEVKE
ncbi:MAG: DUF454 domain-containing protein [Clostridiaceae bacterium]|jgi:uncharacterized membrane protein YbaN (DUF454 family)|nr:DUF454 domain-containing protein [Clostridiaceae bacterium]